LHRERASNPRPSWGREERGERGGRGLEVKKKDSGK